MPAGQLECALAPGEIIGAVVAARQVAVARLLRLVLDEEPGRLARPRHERYLRGLEPAAELGIGRALPVRVVAVDSPPRVNDARQTELVADHGEVAAPITFGVLPGLQQARQRPVGDSEDGHSPGRLVLVQHVDDFAHRHVGVVAVHQPYVGVLHAEAVQARQQLARDALRRAIGGIAAFLEHHHLVTHAAAADPIAQVALAGAVAVGVRGVEAVAAQFEILVEQHLGVGDGDVAVRALHQAGDRLVQSRDAAVPHRRACRPAGPRVSVAPAQRAAGGRAGVEAALLLVHQPRLVAPAVEQLHVADGVQPTHRRRLARVQVLGHGVRLVGEQVAVDRHGNRLRPGVGGAGEEDPARRERGVGGQWFGGVAARRTGRPRFRHLQDTFTAVHRELARHPAVHAAHQLGDDVVVVVVELQRGRRVMVHPGRPQVRAPFHPVRLQKRLAGGRARDQPRRRGSVAANVQDGAAAERIAEGARIGVEASLVAEHGADHAHVADRAFAHQLGQPPRLRVAAIHERLHQEHVVGRRGVNHRRRLQVVHGDRLLHQQVLARLRRLDRPLGVCRVDGAEIDRVDPVVGEQLLVAVVPPANRKEVGQRIGPVTAAARHRRDPPGTREPHRVAEHARDGPRANHSPVQHDPSLPHRAIRVAVIPA